MAIFEGKTPAERNKLIAAIALPLVALVFVLRMLLFSSGPAPRQPANTNRRAQTSGQRGPTEVPPEEPSAAYRPVVYERNVFTGAGGVRNIFAFSERPAGPPKGATPAVEDIPTPTPTPPPPLLLAGLSPQGVFARTGAFTMQVSGDKFTPETRVYIDGQEQPTQFRSSQQLTANVSAALLSGPGSRTVEARTPDRRLYSNPAVLNVMPPPAPTGVYVGLLSRVRFDTAVIKNQKGELINVRKGDLIEEGRFRVTDITERSVEVVDKELNVKHVLPFVESRASGAPVSRGPAPGSIQPANVIQPPGMIQPLQPQPQPQKQKQEEDDEP